MRNIWRQKPDISHPRESSAKNSTIVNNRDNLVEKLPTEKKKPLCCSYCGHGPFVLSSSVKRHEKKCKKIFKNDKETCQEETIIADQENLVEKVFFKEPKFRCRYCGCGPFSSANSAKRHEINFCKKAS